MFQINDLIDLQSLAESEELEFKLAQGKDGKGKLPDDFWPTYSSMSNSRGGSIVLAYEKKRGSLVLPVLPILALSKNSSLILLLIKKRST